MSSAFYPCYVGVDTWLAHLPNFTFPELASYVVFLLRLFSIVRLVSHPIIP